ncbi:beta-1 adrenergic receptor-like [Orbicella faveolata]|uniref:beta-1 adrenergic receptor-like n=1 Tax=Orbicella faveolata TaxID=48498 RepID=UPI0009E1B4F6|nr:beta-1 adrenergic receptor-like [Orbicella faveolata]
MNYTTINTTSASCGSVPYLPLPIAERLSPELHAVFIFRIAINAVSCPFVILLNILVMVAVKTNRRLRTKSNVSLACLATTDLVVGLVVQPLQIIYHSFMLKGETDIICSRVDKITVAITLRCVIASLNHFVVLSAERYLAIKHSFAYENLVTGGRIIVASGLVWVAAITPPMEDFWPANIRNVSKFAVLVTQFIFLALLVYFNISVYREIRRNEKQIIANQVSVEVKEKLLKNKKAFYCTIIVLLTIFLCYFPANIIIVILISITKDRDSITINVKHIMFHFITLLPVLNSLFNPLIYAVRIRSFHVAFIQLLSKKTFAQAEQLERNAFGPKQIQAVATIEQGENRVS